MDDLFVFTSRLLTESEISREITALDPISFDHESSDELDRWVVRFGEETIYVNREGQYLLATYTASQQSVIVASAGDCPSILTVVHRSQSLERSLDLARHLVAVAGGAIYNSLDGSLQTSKGIRHQFESRR